MSATQAPTPPPSLANPAILDAVDITKQFGGLGSIWGVVLGAIVLTSINFYFIPNTFNDLPGKVGVNFDMSQITFAIYGFLLVIMMIMRPEGLIPERRRKQELHEAESGDAVLATTAV